jgi:hypothetical protein
MSSPSRRNFLFLSSGAVAGHMLIPGLAEAEEPVGKGIFPAQSGLATGELKPLRHKSIPGFLIENGLVDLACPNFGIQEAHQFGEATRAVFPGCPEIRDGMIWSNDQPGLGIDIVEEVVDRYRSEKVLAAV